jgi:hypothetical protein
LNSFFQRSDDIEVVPGLVGALFNYALNIVVQRVEVGDIWRSELLGPNIHVVAETILHQMTITSEFSVLLKYMRLLSIVDFDLYGTNFC